MAMIQAGGGKLLFILGAGLTGSYLLNNSQISELLADLTKVLTKHLKESKGDEQSGGELDSTTAALTAQVRRLTQELRQLASTSSRPIVVNSNPSRGGGVLSLIVPVAVVGAAGYGYMWWKGLSLGDLMYVTKKNMSNMVTNVTKQMEGLTAALAATKRQLTGRLDGVVKAVNDNTEVITFVKDEIVETRNNVGRLCLDVNSVQQDIGNVKDQLETIGNQQHIANHGIMLLCRFAIEAQGGHQQHTELIQGLHAYSRGTAARSLSFPSNSAPQGLKLIQGLQEVAEMIGSDSPQQLPPPGATSSPSGAPLPPRAPGVLPAGVLTRSMSAAR